MSLSARAREWARSAIQFALILAALTAVKITIAEAYYVPSGSMEPTLLIGDQLLAVKYAYGYSSASLPPSIAPPPTRRILGALPERGDIVVFRHPSDRSQHWVKRVIGLPGDRIALRAGKLWLNGKAVPVVRDGIGQLEMENGSVITAPRYIETLPGDRAHAIFKFTNDGPYDDVAEVIVPPDHVFVMGDNRDNSADSRVPLAMGGVGMLPTGNLVGRVNSLVGSWEIAVSSQPIWTWPSGLRLSRFFTAVR